MIKVIFIDLGGVLILNRRKEVYEEWSKKLNVSIEDIKTILRNYSSQGMQGKDTSTQDYIKSNNVSWITADQLKDLQQSFWNTEYVNKELLNFINESQGEYIFGIISNNFKEAEEVLLNKFSVPKFYQVFISSAEVGGVLKPDKRIYEYALKQVEALPEECLFIDDYLENVEGAKACGMQAIQFINSESIIKTLTSSLHKI